MELPSKVIVKQEKEMLEVFTGFETRNKYSINSVDGKQLYYAYEESSGWVRYFLKKKRPLKIHVIDSQKKEVMLVERGFAFYFPSHTVSTPNGVVGNIHRRFRWVNKLFDIEYGNVKYTAETRFPHVWTYRVYSEGQQLAQIDKKWSGTGRELFTDADTFMIDFMNAKQEFRKMILATALAIDLNVFERK